jgi:CRP-like cAMP-binding protein
MDEIYLPALLKCELFNNIGKDELKSLLTCLKPLVQTYPKNTIVVRNGDSLDSLGIVLEGQASIFKDSISGNRILLKNIVKGEMFGEIAVFARQNEWPALVQAITPLTVCFFPKNKIVDQCTNACKWHNSLVRNMLGVISERALKLSKKMEYISIKTMRSKLSTFIYEQYLKGKTTTLTLPMNRQQLADFLNVSRPSMSRELSRMRDEGIIDFHLSAVRIIDIEKLKEYCE